MKKLLPTLLIAIVFFSCKKTDPTNNTGPSQWTYDGITHKGATTFVLNAVDLVSIDSLANTIHVYFQTFPTTSGTYTITDIPLSSNQCVIGMDDVNSDSYTSTGAGNNKVTVTIANGKVSASFSNVPVFDGYTTKIVSGVVTEQ